MNSHALDSRPRWVRLSHLAVLLASLPLVLPAQQRSRNDEARTEWMAGHQKMEAAERAERIRDYRPALDLYGEALAVFEKVQRRYPEWNQAIIQYRIPYCKKRISRLAGILNRASEQQSDTDLRKSNQTLSDQLQTSRRKVSDLENQLILAKKALDSARQEAARAGEVVQNTEELLLDNRKLREQNAILDGKLNSLSAELVELRDRGGLDRAMLELEKERQLLKIRQQELDDQQQRMQVELEDLRAVNRRQSLELQAGSAELTAARTANEQFTGQLETMAAGLAAKREELARQQLAIEQRDLRLTAQQKALSEAGDKLAESQARVTATEGELRQAVTDVNQLREQLAANAETRALDQQRLATLAGQVQELTRQLRELKAAGSEETTTLTDQVAALRQQLAARDRELAGLRGQLAAGTAAGTESPPSLAAQQALAEQQAATKAAQQAAAAAEATAQAAKAAAADLEGRLVAAEREAVTQSEAAIRWRGLAETRQQRIAELEEQAEAAADAAAEQQQAQREQSAAARALQQQLDEAQLANRQLAAEFAAERKNLDQLQEANFALRQQLERRDSQTGVHEREEKARRLELLSANTALESARNEAEELHRKYEAQLALTRAQAARLDELGNQLKEAQKPSAPLLPPGQDELAGHRKLVQQLQSDVAAYQQQLEQLRITQLNCDAERAAVAKELARLREALAETRGEQRGDEELLKRQIRKLFSEVDALRAQNEQLRSAAGAGSQAAPAAAATTAAATDDRTVDEQAAIQMLLHKGSVAEAQGQLEAAKWHYQQVLDHDPNQSEALVRLGNLLTTAGDTENGERYLALAFYARPDDKEILLPLGFVLISNEKPDLAISMLSRAAALYPDDPDVHRCLGIACRALGWFDAAEVQFKRSFSLDRTSSDTAFNLAVLYATLEPPKVSEAKHWYDTAVELGAEPDPGLERIFSAP